MEIREQFQTKRIFLIKRMVREISKQMQLATEKKGLTDEILWIDSAKVDRGHSNNTKHLFRAPLPLYNFVILLCTPFPT
jgi:hypothetical protein